MGLEAESCETSFTYVENMGIKRLKSVCCHIYELRYIRYFLSRSTFGQLLVFHLNTVSTLHKSV